MTIACPEKKRIIIIIIIIIITRMLLLQATVKRFQFDLYVNLEALHKKLSVEVLHLILCEEKAQSQAKTRTFFSFSVITSP